MITRNRKQCRERWLNVLSPKLVKRMWTEYEDDKLCYLYHKYGSKWSLMTNYF